MVLGPSNIVRKARKALGPQADQLEAAALFTPSGGVAKEVLAVGLGGAAGGAAGAALLSWLQDRSAPHPGGDDDLAPATLPKQFVVAVLADGLVFFSVSYFSGALEPFGFLRRGSYHASNEGTKGLLAKRLRLVTHDGRELVMDTKYIGGNRSNPRVMDAIIGAGAPQPA